MTKEICNVICILLDYMNTDNFKHFKNESIEIHLKVQLVITGIDKIFIIFYIYFKFLTLIFNYGIMNSYSNELFEIF